MKAFNLPKTPDPTQFSLHVSQLRERLQAMQGAITPEQFARRTGSDYQPVAPNESNFILKLWSQDVNLAYPAWIASDVVTGNELPTISQALLLFYFLTADGMSPEATWISFADLPDGRFYNQAFQGYSGAELARYFQNDLERLGQAGLRCGGEWLKSGGNIPGDLAMRFQALPRLGIAVAFWQGDEDFPASAQILFERSAPHYLPTDVCAYLGSAVTRMLIKAGKG